MDIEMVKCVMGGKEIETTRITLKSVSREELKTLKDQSSPAVFVVRKEDLKFFTELKDLVENKRTKGKASGLGKYMLGRKLIPAIDGNYETAGKLNNGVLKLLAGAQIGKDKRKGKDRNIYVIGVSKTVFEQFVRVYSRAVASQRPAKQAYIDQPLMQEEVKSLAKDGFGGLDELLCVEVPKELEAAYVGHEREVALVRKMVVIAAPSEAKVLILGDTGTGKDVVARQLHRLSGVKGKYVAVNCGGIPTELFESELFGTVKGGYTGATDRPGYWEEAQNGTLFLDEIADLHSRHQTKILRVLETGKIRRVGGKEEISVNARIIAATNKPLLSLVNMRQFREDLFYRLIGFIIHTPALREHPEDIQEIAEHLWLNVVKDERQPLPEEILEELNHYTWPGNVRDLSIVLSYLHTIFPSPVTLTVDHLKAVCRYQGQVLQTVRERVSMEIDRQKMDSLRHLFRVYEVLSTAEMSLKKLIETSSKDSEAIAQIKFELQNRLNELDFLNLYPRRFHPESYYALGILRSKLAFFLSLLKDNVSSAVEDLKSKGLEAFAPTLERIKTDIKNLAVSS